MQSTIRTKQVINTKQCFVKSLKHKITLQKTEIKPEGTVSDKQKERQAYKGSQSKL